MSRTASLLKLLEAGQDGALLRFGLGAAYLQEGRLDEALAHLAEAVRQDPDYSAAWKLYAKALTQAGDIDGAVQAYETGIGVAERRGDIQAAKEMRVFANRLRREG